MKTNLKDVREHFEFGQNWSEFSHLINEKRIEQAETSLVKLVDPARLKGGSFLDIGCGSGLFSLAALNRGVKRLVAVDIDENSVKTTRKVLTSFSKNTDWRCEEISVFDLDPKKEGTFDVVYSWGVLHHTGAMFEAIEKASKFVKDDGVFALSLYKKTPFCGMWTKIKRFYTKSPSVIQKLIFYAYFGAHCLRRMLAGESPLKYIKEYHQKRGMSFSHDAHDWLGGYPYESISPEEMRAFVENFGFEVEREFVTERSIGLFGAPCDEYVLRKKSA